MRFSKRQLAYIVAATLAVSVLAPLRALPAGADPVADKKAEAVRISNRLTELEVRSSQLAEEFNQARIRLGEVQVRMDAAATRVADANGELSRRRAELARYAVDAYVDAGRSYLSDILLKASRPEVSRQIEYLKVVTASRVQLVDAVRVARSRADADLKDLQAAREQADDLRAQLDSRKAETARAAAEQTSLLASVKGELAVLVAGAQAAAAAAGQAAARTRLGGGGTAPTATRPPVAPAPPVTAPGPTAPNPTGQNPNPTPVTAPPVKAPDPSPTPWPVPTGRPPAVLPQAAAVVALAETQLGVPYLWGGDDPRDGFDCSGLVLWAWRNAGGRSFLHSAELQARATRRVTFSDLQPGDLVFYGNPVYHEGMYVGGGRMIEAPRTGLAVRYASIWRSDLVAFGRVT